MFAYNSTRTMWHFIFLCYNLTRLIISFALSWENSINLSSTTDCFKADIYATLLKLSQKKLFASFTEEILA